MNSTKILILTGFFLVGLVSVSVAKIANITTTFADYPGIKIALIQYDPCDPLNPIFRLSVEAATAAQLKENVAVFQKAADWASQYARRDCPAEDELAIAGFAGPGVDSNAVYLGQADAVNNWKIDGEFEDEAPKSSVDNGAGTGGTQAPPPVPLDPNAQLYGVPAAYQMAFSQALAGTEFDFTPENVAFMTGVAKFYLYKCQPFPFPMDIDSAKDFYQFATGGGILSSLAQNESLGLEGALGADAITLQGNYIAERMGCTSRLSGKMIHGLTKSVKEPMLEQRQQN